MSEQPLATRLNDRNRDAINACDRRRLEDVEEYGWHFVHIARSAEDVEEWPELPTWGYSIGLYRRRRRPRDEGTKRRFRQALTDVSGSDRPTLFFPEAGFRVCRSFDS